ncbi:MAG: PAS domain S-box protein [Nitrospirae bacterium]|nr:PAS domain S-box protein [Nitrospirota bacterium]
MKFSTKLTLVFSALGLAFLIAVSYVVYVTNIRIFEDELRDDLQYRTFHTIDNLDRMFYERYADVREIAADSVISSKNSSAALVTERLKILQGFNKIHRTLSFYNLSGANIVSNIPGNMAGPSMAGASKNHPLAAYRQYVTGNKVNPPNDVITDVYVVSTFKDSGIRFASLVKDNDGVPFGLVVSRVSFDVIYDIIIKTMDAPDAGERPEVDLVNEDGLLLYSSSNPAGILKEITPHWKEMKPLIASGKKSVTISNGKTRGPRDKKVETIFAFARELGYMDFRGNGWTLITRLPANVVFAPVNEIIYRMLFISIIFVVTALFFVYTLSRALTRPIKQLNDGLRIIGNWVSNPLLPRDDLDVTIEVSSGDEIGEVTKSFNKMALELKASDKELRRVNELLVNEVRYRKEAEEKATSEAKFPNENPNPVFRVSKDCHIIYANKTSLPVLKSLGCDDNLCCLKDSPFAKFFYDPIREVLLSGQKAPQAPRCKVIEVPVAGWYYHFTIAPVSEMDCVNIYGHNITDRKIAEDALRDSESKFRMLMENASDGIDMIDESGNYIEVNSKACEILGYGREEYLRLNIRDVIHPEDLLMAPGHFDELRAGKTLRVDLRLLRKDGSYIVAEFSIKQLPDERFMAIFRDITARKLAEEKLLLFSRAIETAMDGVHILDLSGKIIYANKAAADITGYSVSESMGMDADNFNRDPNFAANVIIPAINNEGYWEGEVVAKRKDGTLYTIWLVATLIKNIGDQPIAIMGAIRDITSKKAMEEAYRVSEENMRALMNAITESAFLIDPDGVFLAANDTGARRFNKNVHELIGTRLSQYLDQDLRKSRYEHINEVIRTGEPVTFEDRRGEYYFHVCFYPVFGDGHNFSVGWNCPGRQFCQCKSFCPGRQTGMDDAGPIESEAPTAIGVPSETAPAKVKGVAIFAMEISERKAAEEQLKRSLREKEVLLQEIHHRVKNNLQVVSALIELQMEYIDEPSYRDMFRESQNRIKSIALIHEKLYSSKGFSNIDLNGYITNLAMDLFGNFGVDKNNITLALDTENIPIGIDIAIPCGLIINELFTNVLKHAFAGNAYGEIRIGLHWVPPRRTTSATPDGKEAVSTENPLQRHSGAVSDEIELVVKDNGIGMPAGIDFRKTKSLGLHIVVTLVRQLGGTIELKSNGGTEFIITFRNRIA